MSYMALQMKYVDAVALELWIGATFSWKWKPNERKELVENSQEYGKEQGSNEFM